ncbi:phosphatidylserine decarboxylase [Desulfogranum marinum]|uniref:phosphatidylserine decarboxylase n=1 Tax=Desulfogranum marinum TaxID=453220 RepID=UPI0029C9A700|nr:phosphatidylserine decarboxylase [Desulfogranum marinum]
MKPHQYICRHSNEVITERLIGDHSISFLYNTLREHTPSMFKALTSRRMSGLLGYLHFDLLSKHRTPSGIQLLNKLQVDWQECVEQPHYFTTLRKVFERQIRYWETRPMDGSPSTVVSPADAKVLIGSVKETPNLFIKEKFFSVPELLGQKTTWHKQFHDGDFAVFRLTPDKYHYNHFPVSGRIADIYEIEGQYHSCNPNAIISTASIHAKNKRIVTIIDTNIEGGAHIGLVAMIEVVALMIGDIVQCYSPTHYNNPQPVTQGMLVNKGAPKSMYRPGSSTDILIFENKAVSFCADLLANVRRCDVESRFSFSENLPLVETDVQVRSTIGHATHR